MRGLTTENAERGGDSGMATVTKLGPSDHGRALTWEEFEKGDYEEGYQYEIIDGKLYVSPKPNCPQNRLEVWLYEALVFYKREHPEVINYATFGARVLIADDPDTTIPEPDVAAYRNFSIDTPLEDVAWDEVSPILVAEVLSADDPNKDLVRNVELYFQVPSIKEYWILDNRADASRPTLTQRRRHGKRWVVREYAFGDTFTTKLLPGFELIIDPRR